jgi:hypothetical protein
MFLTQSKTSRHVGLGHTKMALWSVQKKIKSMLVDTVALIKAL